MSLIEMYHIVPVGDGFHILCCDDNGHYYLGEKAGDSRDDELLFYDAATAQEYIDRHLIDKDDYVPEILLMRADIWQGRIKE